MPTALDSARTGTPDASGGIKIPTILMREDATLEAPAGVALTDHIANGPTAHRAAVTIADTATDMSSVGFGTSTAVTNNRGAIAVWIEFANSAGSCTLRPVFYDDAGTPVPMALGPSLVFTASAKRVSAAGDFMSEVKLIDSSGFKRFKMFVELQGTGNIDIFAEPI